MQEHKYTTTDISTAVAKTHSSLAAATLYIEEVSGPISTDINYIDRELKDHDKVRISEGWEIQRELV